jgi:hypothetical protein
MPGAQVHVKIYHIRREEATPRRKPGKSSATCIHHHSIGITRHPWHRAHKTSTGQGTGLAMEHSGIFGFFSARGETQGLAHARQAVPLGILPLLTGAE